MIDKIYYCIASLSLLLYCIKECYESKFNKHKDYVRINSIECDLENAFDNYSLLNEENDEEENKTIVKKDKYIINIT
tara:strand:- start:44 stop:274 length:231 start_codon:yes stop_codon:yes gene_type:complete